MVDTQHMPSCTQPNPATTENLYTSLVQTSTMHDASCIVIYTDQIITEAAIANVLLTSYLLPYAAQNLRHTLGLGRSTRRMEQRNT